MTAAHPSDEQLSHYGLGKLAGVILLLAGFLVSSETFDEVRVPFTSIVLRARRAEPEPTGGPAAR